MAIGLLSGLLALWVMLCKPGATRSRQLLGHTSREQPEGEANKVKQKQMKSASWNFQIHQSKNYLFCTEPLSGICQ